MKQVRIFIQGIDHSSSKVFIVDENGKPKIDSVSNHAISNKIHPSVLAIPINSNGVGLRLIKIK